MFVPDAVRLAREGDHPLFERFFAELGLHDAAPGLERWRSQMAPTTFFLERGGQAVGYAWYEVFARDGYVRHVVADPTSRRAGVGRALMVELARRFREAGCERWRLNVKADNAGAIALYRRCGMEVEYPTAVLRLPWRSLAGLPRAPQAIEARSVAPARERALEQAFALPEGRLASLRHAPTVRVLELVDRDAPEGTGLGVACFDPAYPGCFPFKVRRPELAHALLAALEPFAPREKGWIQLVVEDDAPLAQLLVAHEAVLLFEILHFSGPLPADRALFR